MIFVIFYIMQGTHHIYQRSAPICLEMFLAAHQGIIHCWFESNTVNTYKVFQRLIDICQRFRYILLYRCITESHFIEEDFKIVVIRTQLYGYKIAKVLIIGLRYKCFGFDIVEGFAIGKQ